MIYERGLEPLFLCPSAAYLPFTQVRKARNPVREPDLRGAPGVWTRSGHGQGLQVAGGGAGMDHIGGILSNIAEM